MVKGTDSELAMLGQNELAPWKGRGKCGHVIGDFDKQMLH